MALGPAVAAGAATQVRPSGQFGGLGGEDLRGRRHLQTIDLGVNQQMGWTIRGYRAECHAYAATTMQEFRSG
jgi:hypothetical protein